MFIKLRNPTDLPPSSLSYRAPSLHLPSTTWYLVCNTARYYLIFWQLAATRASSFSTSRSLPSSVHPSQIDIGPRIRKSRIKTKGSLFRRRSEIPSTKVTSFLVTQVRAIMYLLLISFITQSGSCTRPPPRLRLCCFPLHRREISSDITTSPLSSTATKTCKC